MIARVHLTVPQTSNESLRGDWDKTHTDRLQQWEQCKVEQQTETLSWIASHCATYGTYQRRCDNS
jgi:hypothetical protein